MDKENTNEQYTSINRRSYFLFIILGILAFGMLAFIGYRGYRTNVVHSAMEEAVNNIKFEITVAHLWFEEYITGDITGYITGDINEDINSVWEHVAEAQWFAISLLEGGTTEERIFYPLTDQILRQEVEVLIMELSDLRIKLEERLVTIPQAGIGSELDQAFDAEFNNLITNADELKSNIHNEVTKGLNSFVVTVISLIGVFGLISGLMFFSFRRFEHQRKQAFDLIQTAHLEAETSEKWLATILDSIGDGMIATDTEGQIIRMNSVAEELTGWKFEEAYKTDFENVFNIVNEHSRKTVENPVRYVLREGGIVGLANHTLLITKSGEELPIADSGAPIKNENGETTGVVMIFRDQTKERQAQEEIRNLNKVLEQRVLERTAQLEASNKELEAFSYSISHDLRAPLRAINGFSQILFDEYSGLIDEEGKRYLSNMQTATKKMDDLINDLLALSRLGRREIKFTTINLATLADNIFKEHVKAEKGRKINFQAACDHLVTADHHLIEVLLNNLIGNSIKFTQGIGKAEIQFGCQKEGKKIVFFLQDNGVGFDMKYVDKLFNPFQRLHSDEDFEGTGIGLAIVKRIIQIHNGEVWVESKLGKGATFFFTVGENNKRNKDD